MQGLHLTADLYQCSCDSALMICADTIAQLCRSQTDASGLTLVEDKWVKFPEWQGQPGGVTGAVLLAESHLAIHTWPETGNVTIDVYVCNFSGDNSAKAQALMDGVVAAYAPQEAVRQQLWRGDIATNGVGQYPWVMEQLTENAAFGFRAHNVQRLVLAELDEAVIEVSKAQLQRVHNGVWDDPRLQLQIGDGMAYVDSTTDRFDLILLDLTDPHTPAGSLYSPEALERMRRVLNPGGALVLHLGSPVFHAEQVRSLSQTLKATFAQVACYGTYVPLYGAYWGMAVCSDRLQPTAVSAAQIEERLAARGVTDLQYYNADIHGALFALPNYYRKLVLA